MKRAELYRVRFPKGDAKNARVMVVVSRQGMIDRSDSTVVCAPVYTVRPGLRSTVDVGPDEGLKHESSIRCDLVTSIPKAALTNYVGLLGPEKLVELDRALRYALGLEDD